MPYLTGKTEAFQVKNRIANVCRKDENFYLKIEITLSQNFLLQSNRLSESLFQE